MNIVILTKYVHYVSVFFVFATLFLEYHLLQSELQRKTIQKLFKIDGLYGLFAILAVAAGLTLWLGIGKPAEFYSENGLIHLKLGLFSIVGILSIIPSVFFFKNRKGDPDDLIPIPGRLKKIVLIELLILITMPLWATLMANGIKVFG